MRALIVAMGLGLSLAACSSGFAKVVHPPPQPLACTTVFVYPFHFAGSAEPAFRAFALAQRLVDGAVRSHGERFAFYGPSEFRLLKPQAPALWAASTALPLLTRSGSRPDQGLALRASAEKRVLSSSRQAQDAAGRARGASAQELTTWLGKVEIFHPSTGSALVEVSGEVTVDPFEEPPPEAEFDPAPALSRLMAQLTRQALNEAARHAADREVGPEVDATLAVTPRTVLAVGESSAGAEAELARLDVLEAELFLQNQARFLSPWLTDAQAAKLSRAPPGLAVMAAPASSKVQPGDVLLSIEGELALPQVLARQRLRGVPVEAQLRRADGSTHAVVLP